jgi:type 1 glutamine amidotransferase
MTDGRRASSIVVVSGVRPHADPWHALDATSSEVATLIADLGDVRVTTTAETGSWADADLLIVNAGGDLETPAPQSRAQVDAILRHHRAGRPLMAFHSATLAFRDDRRWSDVLGGRWVPGVTMHPQIGHALIQACAGSPQSAPAVAADFLLYDERYTALEVGDDVEVLAFHTEDGRKHPLIWWRAARDGHGAVAYDALGHGVESFASVGHREWIRSCVTSLLGEPLREGGG